MNKNLEKHPEGIESLNRELSEDELEHAAGGMVCAFSCDPHDCPDSYTCHDVFKCSTFGAELQ